MATLSNASSGLLTGIPAPTISVELLQLQVANLSSQLSVLQDNFQRQGVDDFFLTTMGMIVLFMQCGFAFLEAGSVRSTNTTSILLQNMIDMFACGISYWIIGYTLAYGPNGNGFIGWGYVAGADMPPSQVARWFFQFVFAATAATIVSGAVAERCKLVAYFIYSTALTAFIYPVASHWAWGGGWLQQYGYTDYAGSGVVHAIGGIASLVGAYVLGPRLERFSRNSDDGRLVNHKTRYSGHSVPLTALGGFVLTFGFLAFNCGSQQSVTKPQDGIAIARSAMNTMVSGSSAAFAAMLMKKFAHGKWSLLTTINGSLVGMVAVCAGCDTILPWSAAVIGVVATVLYKNTRKLMSRAGIDDPLDAVAVHLAGGCWGVLAQPLFKYPNGVLFTWNADAFKSLGWNAVGLAALIGWSGILCAILFVGINKLNLFRLEQHVELAGLDDVEHGEPAYPIHANPHWHSLVYNSSMSMLQLSTLTLNGPAAATAARPPPLQPQNVRPATVCEEDDVAGAVVNGELMANGSATHVPEFTLHNCSNCSLRGNSRHQNRIPNRRASSSALLKAAKKPFNNVGSSQRKVVAKLNEDMTTSLPMSSSPTRPYDNVANMTANKQGSAADYV